MEERRIWQFSWAGRRRFDPVWNMVLEGSTGFSGAFARQVTANQQTADKELTVDLLDALEQSAGEESIVLECEGAFISEEKATPTRLQYDANFEGGKYVEVDGERDSFTRDELVSLALFRSFVGTFTARHRANSDNGYPQPALWTLGPIEAQRGRQEFPILFAGNRSMTISGRHLDEAAYLRYRNSIPGSPQRLASIWTWRGSSTTALAWPSYYVITLRENNRARTSAEVRLRQNPKRIPDMGRRPRIVRTCVRRTT